MVIIFFDSFAPKKSGRAWRDCLPPARVALAIRWAAGARWSSSVREGLAPKKLGAKIERTFYFMTVFDNSTFAPCAHASLAPYATARLPLCLDLPRMYSDHRHQARASPASTACRRTDTPANLNSWHHHTNAHRSDAHAHPDHRHRLVHLLPRRRADNPRLHRDGRIGPRPAGKSSTILINYSITLRRYSSTMTLRSSPPS